MRIHGVFMAYVYILQSLRNNRYYVGSTADIKQRLVAHQSGNVKATKNLLPLEIVFKQKFLNIHTAKQIERKIKKLKRRDYIENIIRDKYIKIGAHSSVG